MVIESSSVPDIMMGRAQTLVMPAYTRTWMVLGYRWDKTWMEKVQGINQDGVWGINQDGVWG